MVVRRVQPVLIDRPQRVQKLRNRVLVRPCRGKATLFVKCRQHDLRRDGRALDLQALTRLDMFDPLPDLFAYRIVGQRCERP